MKRPSQLQLFTEHIPAPCRHCGWPALRARMLPATGRAIFHYCTECGWVDFNPPAALRLIARSKTA